MVAPEGIAMTEANDVLASVTTILVKVIKTLPNAYHIPNPLPWTTIAGLALTFIPHHPRALTLTCNIKRGIPQATTVRSNRLGRQRSIC